MQQLWSRLAGPKWAALHSVESDLQPIWYQLVLHKYKTARILVPAFHYLEKKFTLILISWSRSFDHISATQLWWSMYLYSLCFCISLLHFGRLVCTICCSAPFAIMNHSEAFYWFYLPSFFSSWLNIIFSEKATKISSNPFRFDWLKYQFCNK